MNLSNRTKMRSFVYWVVLQFKLPRELSGGLDRFGFDRLHVIQGGIHTNIVGNQADHVCPMLFVAIRPRTRFRQIDPLWDHTFSKTPNANALFIPVFVLTVLLLAAFTVFALFVDSRFLAIVTAHNSHFSIFINRVFSATRSRQILFEIREKTLTVNLPP